MTLRFDPTRGDRPCGDDHPRRPSRRGRATGSVGERLSGGGRDPRRPARRRRRLRAAGALRRRAQCSDAGRRAHATGRADVSGRSFTSSYECDVGAGGSRARRSGRAERLQLERRAAAVRRQRAASNRAPRGVAKTAREHLPARAPQARRATRRSMRRAGASVVAFQARGRGAATATSASWRGTSSMSPSALKPRVQARCRS